MTRRRKFKGERLRRGIYILPNIFTSLNIFFGFYSVIAAINGKYVAAALAIIIAAVFDMLDGKIARATHTTSKFGVEYDSLADLISFGLAPGLMMYLYALKPLGRIGWLAAFLFMVCGALRLARFNTQVGTISSDHFVGLPIPAAAGMSSSSALVVLCALMFLRANGLAMPGLELAEFGRVPELGEEVLLADRFQFRVTGADNGRNTARQRSDAYNQ